MIWYSQEARAYMLLAALTGASFLFFARARRNPSKRNLAFWTGCSALALMTHFFAGFLVAPEALWLLWIHRNRLMLAAVGVVALTQLAMLPFAISDTSHGVSWITAIPRIDRISTAISEWGVSALYWRVSMTGGLLAGAVVLVITISLILVGGDRRTIDGARVAGAIAGFVLLAPLALALVGQDYFLSRNVIPAFIPLATVVAAACVAPRTRVLGGVFALALLAIFTVGAITVQSSPTLERPDWRAVAHALSRASGVRAILVSGGSTAQPLKIYLPGVDWTESHRRKLLIAEVDVVGAAKRVRLRPVTSAVVGAPVQTVGQVRGWPLPRSRPPSGARLIARFHLANWVIARYAFEHPLRTTIAGLTAHAPEFFRATPAKLLVFAQPPGK
jgi:hypothetical protein